MSFADAFIERRTSVAIEVDEPEYLPPGPNTLCHDMPTLPLPPFLEPRFAFMGSEPEMGDAVAELARSSRSLERREQIQMQEIAQERMNMAYDLTNRQHLIEHPYRLLPDPTMFVDFLPYFRLVMEADIDNAAKLKGDEGVAGVGVSETQLGRPMRRSNRLAGVHYQFKLEWDDMQKVGMRELGFSELS
ncbi:hypothetical protein T439DRAFT_327867 [Meredithblackwellia eburnea MCA 4105]